MPVPASIDDLSTTAGDNSPAGSEAPTDGDNYLRTFGAFIATLRDKLNGTSDVGTLKNPTITGYISSSTQPCFRAVRSGSTDQTSGTVVVFDSEGLDNTSSYNNSTGVFTVPETGHYFFAASIVLDGADFDWLAIEASTTGRLDVDVYSGSRKYMKLHAFALLQSGETVSVKRSSGSAFSSSLYVENGAIQGANMFCGAMLY